MPKSKVQKQQEALERFRLNFGAHRQRFFNIVFHTSKDMLRQWGQDHMHRRIDDATMEFTRAMKNAMMDHHGNPVDETELQKSMQDVKTMAAFAKTYTDKEEQ